MSFIPPVSINIVSGGVVQFGGAVFVSPKGSAKTAQGSGGNNTGAQVITISGFNSTNTAVTDVIDQPIVQDA
ncbi:spore germination protein [Neobacillus vireti]|uniref:spore germination protein n=1 Tax=Neobacillus vireti TaxID=220686 RepID=UPI002FFFA6DF